MDTALVGLAGAVIGVVLGGTGKYFVQRRDAWAQARTAGLLLLATVRALGEANATDDVVTKTEFGVVTWEAHREVLAGFRRGTFPNGFRAGEWLALAGHFAHLEQLYARYQVGDGESEDDATTWAAAKAEWAAADSLLARFAFDPPVLSYVLRNAVRLRPRRG